MKPLAFISVCFAVVISILFALAGLSSAQQNSSTVLNKNRALPVSLENDKAIVQNVNTGEILSVRPAGEPASGALPPPATNYNFQVLPAPTGAWSSYAGGINSNGTAVVGGYYPTSAPNAYGFIYTKAGQTAVNYPGSSSTVLTGINDKGVVIGNYANSGSSGFTYQNGHYTALPSVSNSVNLEGISDSNAIVLEFIPPGDTIYHSILTSKGTTTKIIFPGAPNATYGEGVNESGEVVGQYQTTGFFGFTEVNGVYTSFQVPGTNTQMSNAAVSNNGNIAGTFLDSSLKEHGFTLINGQFTTIDYPGATGTQLYGIDDAGDVVGIFLGPVCTLKFQTCGFLATVQ